VILALTCQTKKNVISALTDVRTWNLARLVLDCV
jgi:hypothetical protein